MSEYSRIVDVMTRAARDAAAIINEIYSTDFSVQFKGKDDPVTIADQRCNDLICEQLATAFPNIPIVAEESAPETYQDFRKSDRVFFVDPLDGTKEFVKRNGEFVVMIGLVEGDTAVAGVLVAPVTNKCWTGVVGEQAYCATSGGEQTPINVSDVDRADLATLVGSRSHRTKDVERGVKMLGVRQVTHLGSAGLKGAAIASGDADGWIAPFGAGKLWDVCAADAIIHAAGGAMTDIRGQRFDYRSSSLVNDTGILATNGRLHEDFIEKLRKGDD